MKLIRKLLFTLIILLSAAASSQTIKYCDSLISAGIAETTNRNHIKALELLTHAHSIAESKQWDDRTYSSLLGIGNVYYEMYDFGEALHYFFECYTIAVKKLKPIDEIAALNNIANLYTRDEKYDKAIEYYKKAYELAADKDIDERKGLPLMNLAYIYNKTNQLDEARDYILQALPYLQSEFEVAGKVVLIENELLRGNTQEARKKAFDLYGNTSPSKVNNLGSYVWLIIAKSYFKESNFDMAAKYGLNALQTNPEPNVKRDVLTLLSDVYTKNGIFSEALKYKDSIIKLDQSLYEIKNGRAFYNNRVKFEVQNYKNEILDKEQKIASDQKIFYSTITILLAIVIIILLFVRQMKIIAQRNQKTSELDLEREKNHNLELEKRITDAHLEQERLKNDIEAKNRKLSAKALYLSDRNELIEEIVAYLSKKPILAKDATLANHVRSLKANLRTDNEWDNFITHFEEVNHGFLTRLKTLHPHLTANDIKFIAYIYMNLSVKEIASILNITVLACKKRKERLAAKMEIPKDSDLFTCISMI